MKFDSDIFLNFADLDDQVISPAAKRSWVDEFQRALRLRVAQLLGKEPRISTDADLEGGDPRAQELIDRLAKVALLVPVLSPPYFASTKCLRELHAFLEAAAKMGGIRFKDRARLFKVLKSPLPEAEDPPELGMVLGYEFFTTDPETGAVRELKASASLEDQRQYWARLEDLAYDMCQTLQLLRVSAGALTSPREAPAAEEEAVYLAAPSFDLRQQYDLVKRELQQHGYTVLPDRPLPMVADDLETMVRDQLARCRLSVHLVGSNFGGVALGSADSIVGIQNQLAVERGAAGDFSRLIWTPPGLEIDDERQRRLIEKLQMDSKNLSGADFLESPLEELKSAILRKLDSSQVREGVAAAPAAGLGAAGGDLTRIYLICDQTDLDSIATLEDFLYDQGFEVILPAFDGDETQVRLDHEESLCNCDAALLYYGEGTELWLRSKLREVQKSVGFGRAEPMLAKAIYVAPPVTPHKLRLRTREAQVIRAAQTFEPTSLEPFLTEIAQEKARSA